MARVLFDIRLALRSWRKAPSLTVIVIASIALGIGANTAIFTLVDQVLLRRLPVKDPDALVQVTKTGISYGNNWGDGSELSYPMYERLRDGNEVFDGVFARFATALNIGYGGRTDFVLAEAVTGTYFPVLGVGAALGRTILPSDDGAPGASTVAVLSHGFWMSRFAGDPGIVGQAVIVNNRPYTVVGVAQPGFEGIELGRPAQVFVPIVMKAHLTPAWNGLDDPRFAWVRVFGRLKPRVSKEQAAAAVQTIYRAQIQEEVRLPGFANASTEVRKRYLENRISLLPGGQGRSAFRRAVTSSLWVLMAIAGGVLLIACANVANLLLARAAGRQREMAIRLALGATRLRLVQQLLIESLLLALVGGAIGIFISMAAAPMVLNFFVTPEVREPISTTPDARILAFTFAVSALTGILFGLAPAVQSTRPDVTPALKNNAGSVVGGSQARFRKVLVASQVAIALLLLVSAGLFLRTLNNLLSVDIGFSTESLISFSMDPSRNGYTPERTRQLASTLLERLRNTPGVVGAGFVSQRLLDGSQWSSSITVEGYLPQGDSTPGSQNNAVSPGYFKAMGIPLLRGREFTDRDVRTTPLERGASEYRVAVANETFARAYFKDREPLGHRIGFGDDPNTPTTIEIIGIVRDSKYRDVREEVRPQLFVPYLESSTPGVFTTYVRSAHPAEVMFGIIRTTVQSLDPNLPLNSTRTLQTQVRQSLRNERMIATMSVVFGSLATLLAIVGLYGVMSYTVSRRTREIGVRMALGAASGNIARMVIKEVLTISAIGVAAGLPMAWWLSRFVESQLFGVQARDAATLSGAVIILTVVSLVAGVVPSARAARVTPTTALRYE
jgi:predicted permease